MALPIRSSVQRSFKTTAGAPSTLRTVAGDGSPVANQSNGKESILRQHHRQRVRINALLYKGEIFQSVVICDLSQGGAGLQNCQSLMENDLVTLKLVNGRSFDAYVRWWFAGACGLRFTELLEPADKLLNHSTRAVQAGPELKFQNGNGETGRP